MTGQPTFALVAGETSGDQLGAALITELKKQYPLARFVGIGGDGMRAAGMDTWWDSQELAVFGLFEVLAHFPRLLRIRRELRRRLLNVRPDVFIGIDAPDFNLGLEKQLKVAGIRTIHYVSPTVWAWRPQRVRKIARAADLVLCLFPFEPSFYRDHGVAAAYVGHPMAEQIPLRSDALEARRQLGLNEHRRVIALLPGSRVSEVSCLSGPLIESSSLLSQNDPDLQFVAAIANPKVGDIFQHALNNQQPPEIKIIEGSTRLVLAAADVVICASGTVTLEAMLINRPLVSIYRVAPATYLLIRSTGLIRRQFFALPNILAGQALVPELIQHEVTAERLALETQRWLQDKTAREALSERFKALHRELLVDDAEGAGAVVIAFLQSPT